MPFEKGLSTVETSRQVRLALLGVRAASVRQTPLSSHRLASLSQAIAPPQAQRFSFRIAFHPVHLRRVRFTYLTVMVMIFE